jgi:GMP synthase-like glutamine amidotransferase
MNIILIQCGHISDNLQYISGDFSDIFHRFFSKYEPKIHLDVYDATMGELPDENAKTDGILFSGSAHSASEDKKWILQTKSFIRELYRKRRKMVGICFGHQIIAESLGGSVKRSSKGWGVGVQSVTITKQARWMIPAVMKCNVLVKIQWRNHSKGAYRFANRTWMFCWQHITNLTVYPSRPSLANDSNLVT